MELLDVLDENGNTTGNTEDKDIIHDKGIWHREIAILIQNEEGKYLIQKRALTKKQAPNKWGLTAGHVSVGETFEEALIREVKEELGINIDINDVKEIGIYKQPFESEKTSNNNFTKYYYYKTNREIQDYTICIEELSELKYISLSKLETAVKNKDDNYSFTKRTAMKDVIQTLKSIN